ncbi:S-layer homology domain-containing protein [Halobacillus sp. SY10]|uniref:S-layer homology domain-containing protein n=1 Tax=Halobacillus sp. SY10 TaxID=3381356 RepID=UPI00387929FE
MKKLLFMTSVVMASLMIPNLQIHAYPFEPVDIEGHWAYEELDQFAKASLVQGYELSDGKRELRPDQSITRAEFVTILNRALELKKVDGETDFQDIKGKWYEESVRIASSHGLVNGVGQNNFAPNRDITRAEIATIIIRAMEDSVDFSKGSVKTFEDVSQHWALEAINQASKVGIIQGVSTTEFKPNRNANRAESIVMIKRALDKEQSDAPTEEYLVNLIHQLSEEWTSALETKNYEKLRATQDRTTGYYEAMQSISNSYDIKGMEDGNSVEYEGTTPKQGHAVHIANRFADVKVTQGEVERTVIFPYERNGSNVWTSSISEVGTYRFYKEDGTWKIYDIQSQGEEGLLLY